MEPHQAELFPSQSYKSEFFPQKPSFTDPSWDEDPPIISHPQIGVYKDIPELPNLLDSVLEQVNNDTVASAPEHTQWVETYYVKRCGKKHYYYRYCWMVSRKIRHIHIPGGCSANKKSQGYCQQVKDAIAKLNPPQEIEKLIRSWCVEVQVK